MKTHEWDDAEREAWLAGAESGRQAERDAILKMLQAHAELLATMVKEWEDDMANGRTPDVGDNIWSRDFYLSTLGSMGAAKRLASMVAANRHHDVPTREAG